MKRRVDDWPTTVGLVSGVVDSVELAERNEVHRGSAREEGGRNGSLNI